MHAHAVPIADDSARLVLDFLRWEIDHRTTPRPAPPWPRIIAQNPDRPRDGGPSQPKAQPTAIQPASRR